MHGWPGVAVSLISMYVATCIASVVAFPKHFPVFIMVMSHYCYLTATTAFGMSLTHFKNFDEGNGRDGVRMGYRVWQ